jgi:DNA segregation ATPase FtsK/SpoIIIE, S-DNA-T family
MMGIGYPKVARIIQQLEEEGVVGPQNGSKPRDVYALAEEG